ncbi:S8 family serine peptidase [Verrucomicrobiota bacterium sgz303538]
MTRFALFLLTASSLTTFASGAPLQETYRIHDHGQPREFVIAKDELHRGRQPQRIPAKASVDETRQAAQQIAGDFVLYEKGQPRTEQSRRILTKRLSIHLAAGTDAVTVASAAGVRLIGPAPSGEGWWLMEAGAEPGSALEAAEVLRKQPGVLAADPLLARQQSRRFIPNDPLFSKEWHLTSDQAAPGAGATMGANVQSVWDSYRGNGVTIGIVDDGVERTHPDLISNFNAALSYDFNSNDGDPLPPPFDGDDHGTSCAGVAAARGNNGIGVCGAAFEAQIAGLRLISAPTTDAEEAEAFAFRNDAIQIKSQSWGPYDDGRHLEGPGPLAISALEKGAREGRGGLGTIYVWAAGNGAMRGDNSNFDGYANRREVIAVGALTNDGEKASYSESGANLLITAPSDGGTLGITTTDRQGEDGYNYDGFLDLPDLNYTQTFGGTSSAAPLVAGCTALILQANPQLGWRDLQEILIRSARMVQPLDSGWSINAAGLHFHDSFGAGLIDTQAAINLAKTWTKLGPEISIQSEQANLAQPIPDNRPAGIEKTFVFNDDHFRVEHVCLTVDILHASRGQLEITVESPAGTISRMAPVRSRDKGDHYLGWTFMSTHHWGELASGTWKVRVVDKVRGTSGVLRSLKMELFGSSLAGHPAPESYTVVSGSDSWVQPGETVSVSFAIRNDGQSVTSNLVGTLLATGGVTNPSSPQTYGVIQPGGTGAQTFTFTAEGTIGQTIYATIELHDGPANLGTVTFPIILGQLGPIVEGDKLGTVTFTSNESVQIPARLARKAGNARPYPSTVEVSGLPANAVVTKVILHLNHLAHQRSADLDLLLVGPDGHRMIPFSDVGGYDAPDIDIVLDDAATTSLPGTAPLFGGTFRPTNQGATIDSFPSPAPPKPYGANFAVFTHTPANGTWKLFIRDDATGAVGGLGSWSLEMSYAY